MKNSYSFLCFCSILILALVAVLFLRTTIKEPLNIMWIALMISLNLAILAVGAAILTRDQ